MEKKTCVQCGNTAFERYMKVEGGEWCCKSTEKCKRRVNKSSAVAFSAPPEMVVPPAEELPKAELFPGTKVILHKEGGPTGTGRKAQYIGYLESLKVGEKLRLQRTDSVYQKKFSTSPVVGISIDGSTFKVRTTHGSEYLLEVAP